MVQQRDAFHAGAPEDDLPSGTVMLFRQAAAPVGWTRDVASTLDDASLRIVTSTSWADGKAGATAFSSVFGSGKTAGNTKLTGGQSGTSAHLHTDGTYAASSNGAHTHTVQSYSGSSTQDGISWFTGNDVTESHQDVAALSDGAHTHDVTGSSGTTSEVDADDNHNHTVSLDLHHVMMILASKD